MVHIRWSQSLLDKTLKLLISNGTDVLPTPDGYVHFKNQDGRYGRIDLISLISGSFDMVDKKTGDIEIFSSAEALISAGWVID